MLRIFGVLNEIYFTGPYSKNVSMGKISLQDQSTHSTNDKLQTRLSLIKSGFYFRENTPPDVTEALAAFI